MQILECIADSKKHKTLLTHPAIKSFVHLKNDGTIKAEGSTIELNGNIDNAVKFTPLDASLQSQASLINTNFTQIAAALNTLAPGAYVPTTVTVNINTSKVETVKLP